MKFKIPVNKNTDSYSQSVELDGQVFNLSFHFNNRENKWYLSLSRNDFMIIEGMKLVHGNNLFAQYRAYDVPKGVLSIVDSSGLFQDPSSLEFGNTIQLQYDDTSI